MTLALMAVIAALSVLSGALASRLAAAQTISDGWKQAASDWERNSNAWREVYISGCAALTVEVRELKAMFAVSEEQ